MFSDLFSTGSAPLLRLFESSNGNRVAVNPWLVTHITQEPPKEDQPICRLHFVDGVTWDFLGEVEDAAYMLCRGHKKPQPTEAAVS